MIKNGKRLRSFEIELAQKEKRDFSANLMLIESMFMEAVALGAFPLKEPLSGLEVDIKIAKALNSVQRTP